MKKILTLLISAAMGTGMMTAQNNCVQLFPENEGSVLITKTYDARNNLLNTMTYRVNSINNNAMGSNSDIGFTMADRNNNVISTANIEARCNNGTFTMRMVNRGYSPEVVRALTNNTELIGYFLNYPNTINANNFMLTNNSPFAMDGGEFTIEDNSDNRDRVNVRVYNRQHEGNESVVTPARRDSFNASKVSFNFDVTTNGNTTTYKGIEWHAPNHGIVRSETYDNNNNLLTRTELSEMRLL